MSTVVLLSELLLLWSPLLAVARMSSSRSRRASLQHQSEAVASRFAPPLRNNPQCPRKRWSLCFCFLFRCCLPLLLQLFDTGPTPTPVVGRLLCARRSFPLSPRSLPVTLLSPGLSLVPAPAAPPCSLCSLARWYGVGRADKQRSAATAKCTARVHGQVQVPRSN